MQKYHTEVLEVFGIYNVTARLPKDIENPEHIRTRILHGGKIALSEWKPR